MGLPDQAPAQLHGALRRAGIAADAGKITLHSARHTFAPRMLNSELSLVEVQGLLGHKYINSTMICSHVETRAVAEKAARVLNESAPAELPDNVHLLQAHQA